MEICSPQKLYMPVWSFEELQQACTERTKEDIEHLYLVYGGIPRYVIKYLKENPAQDTEAEIAREQRVIRMEVGCLTLEAIETMAFKLMSCTISDKTSHRILQIYVREGEDGKPDYKQQAVYFASEFVLETVFNKFQSRSESEL